MGMPVFNGEPYLEPALRSLLDQSFEDFELIISDNASTDRTEAICRDLASRDRRIRYSRNPGNVGYCRNQNSVIEQAQGAYFLLTHHDDLRHPEYLEKTIPVLDGEPDVVVCYTNTRDIDEGGAHLPRIDPPLRLDSRDLRERFRDIIRMDHLCEPDFGLTRLAILRRTRLHGAYADSDRVLLGELVLRGRFRRLPEVLFFRRAHQLQSTSIAPNRQARSLWFDPALEGKLTFPHFRELAEFVAVIRRVPLNRADRFWCLSEMLRWTRANRGRLFSDLDFAFREAFRPYYRRLAGRAA